MKLLPYFTFLHVSIHFKKGNEHWAVGWVKCTWLGSYYCTHNISPKINSVRGGENRIGTFLGYLSTKCWKEGVALEEIGHLQQHVKIVLKTLRRHVKNYRLLAGFFVVTQKIRKFCYRDAWGISKLYKTNQFAAQYLNLNYYFYLIFCIKPNRVWNPPKSN